MIAFYKNKKNNIRCAKSRESSVLMLNYDRRIGRFITRFQKYFTKFFFKYFDIL